MPERGPSPSETAVEKTLLAFRGLSLIATCSLMSKYEMLNHIPKAAGKGHLCAHMWGDAECPQEARDGLCLFMWVWSIDGEGEQGSALPVAGRYRYFLHGDVE